MITKGYKQTSKTRRMLSFLSLIYLYIPLLFLTCSWEGSLGDSPFPVPRSPLNSCAGLLMGLIIRTLVWEAWISPTRSIWNTLYHHNSNGRNNLKLILGTAAPGIGILLILLFCIIRKLSLSESRVFWKNRSESYQNVENILKNYESFSPERYTYSDVKKMTNSFRVKLGQGGFGCVFKGTLENGSLVAAKVLKGLKQRRI